MALARRLIQRRSLQHLGCLPAALGAGSLALPVTRDAPWQQSRAASSHAENTNRFILEVRPMPARPPTCLPVVRRGGDAAPTARTNPHARTLAGGGAGAGSSRPNRPTAPTTRRRCPTWSTLSACAACCSPPSASWRSSLLFCATTARWPPSTPTECSMTTAADPTRAACATTRRSTWTTCARWRRS